MCAERVAVFKAVSEGMRGFDSIAVVVDSPKPAAPCGPCRQILWEFCGDIWVRMENLRGRGLTRRMSELLPLPFDQGNL
jgi:cytidine deaminase